MLILNTFQQKTLWLLCGQSISYNFGGKRNGTKDDAGAKKVMLMSKFSVIIPVYNVEKYLRQCIDSVLNQTYTDFEVILVDDGSPDNCPAICDEYAERDSRVKVIHKENAGVSLARQDGVSIANGEYLVFVDADDRITDDFFEVISEHTDVDMIQFGYVVERPDGSFVQRFPKEKAEVYEKHDIEREVFPYLIQSQNARYYCPSLCRHVFKRELFVANMVKNVVIKIGEDGACVIPCVYHAQSMYFVHKCLYIYNYNDASETKGKKIFPWDGPKLIAEHLSERIDLSQYDFRKQLDRKIVHDLFLVIASQFNSVDSYRKIIHSIKQELQLLLYQEAIRNASFSGSLKASLMMTALRHKLFFLISLYSKI